MVGVAFGIAIAQLGEEARTIGNLFHNLMAVSMKITQWVILISPLGIMFLVTSQILKMKDLLSAIASLGAYFGTVCLGLGIQGFIVLPLLYLVLARRNPIPFMKNISSAVITGFGTASRLACTFV